VLQKFIKFTITQKVIVHYDPTLPIMLMVDNSRVGVGVALCHTVQEHWKTVEKSVPFASCTSNDTQSRYSQIEALAVIFSVKRCLKYPYGRRFTIVTDNQATSHDLIHVRPCRYTPPTGW